ncbi:MAG: divalent-cation tolerance protein CutA [Candidatus Kapabacteria bacterium]|nr:divalent-cation tolerance protein CutA [Candidatus Kapabacteria bacterium]
MENSDIREASDVSVVLTTFPDTTTAETVMHMLLAEQLIACATLLPGATSLYAWQGEFTRATEVQVLVKTRTTLLVDACRRLAEVHPYQTPEILCLGVSWGATPYLDWILQSTRP